VRLPGRVAAVESHGREMLYAVDLADGSRLRAIGSGLGQLDQSEPVEWGIDPRKLLVFDQDGVRL